MAKATKSKTKPAGIGHNGGPKLSERMKLMKEDKPKASDAQLKSISSLVQEHVTLSAEVAALGEATKNAQEKINAISNDRLPKAMQAAGTSLFTDDATGIKVKLQDHLSCKWPNEEEMPKENAAALAFLKQEKAEDLMKCLLEAQFGKQEFALAQKFFKEILKTKKATVQLYKGVHGSTLKKWIKERLKSGKKVPVKVFSVEQFIRASVTMPNEEASSED